MSLTSRLRDSRSPVGAFLRTVSPQLTVTDGKWHDAEAAASALGFDEIVTLPTTAPRPDGVDAGTAGAAFDLRARMMLTAAAPAQSTAVLSLARVPTTAEYPGASEDELRVFGDVFEAASRIVESDCTDEDLDRAAVLLAWCDAAYRAGPSSVAKGSLGQLLSAARAGEDVAARIPADLLADLAAMRTSGHNQLQQWTTAISAGTRFTPNPQLTGRDIVVGAVPDWLVGSTLIECKTNEPVTPSKLRDALLQLLGYVLLDLDDAHHIREVAVWLPRRGALPTWSLDQLLGTDADVELPRLRAEFQTLFDDYLRDWADDGWIPGTVHPTGGFDQHVGKPYVHEWLRNGIRHREDGPAVIEADRTQLWYRDGQLHREDGPAIIWNDGTQELWLHGRQYKTQADWEQAKAKPIA